MDLESQEERGRLIHFVRDRVEAAQEQSDERLLELIAGYPGVLNFWTDETVRSQMRTEADLQREAENAQATRYLDLDELLSQRPDDRCALAARLAFFPRLDTQQWSVCAQRQSDSDIDDRCQRSRSSSSKGSHC